MIHSTLNIIVITAIIAWAVSQVSKVVFGCFRYGAGDLKRSSWRLIWASGMPSSHSALTTSVLTITGLHYGPADGLFGLAFVVASIVIYDRSRMHKIFVTFRDRFPELQRKAADDPMLGELVGHSTAEIVAGCIIGAATGACVFWAFG